MALFAIRTLDLECSYRTSVEDWNFQVFASLKINRFWANHRQQDFEILNRKTTELVLQKQYRYSLNTDTSRYIKISQRSVRYAVASRRLAYVWKTINDNKKARIEW